MKKTLPGKGLSKEASDALDWVSHDEFFLAILTGLIAGCELNWAKQEEVQVEILETAAQFTETFWHAQDSAAEKGVPKEN